MKKLFLQLIKILLKIKGSKFVSGNSWQIDIASLCNFILNDMVLLIEYFVTEVLYIRIKE